MKNIYRILMCVAMLAFAGIDNSAFAGYYEDYIYSNAYDGYVNIRQQPTTKSTVLGAIPNGNFPAEFIEVAYNNNNWYYIYYKGIYGYVAKSQVGWSPVAAVNLSIKATWLAGTWINDNDYVIACDKSGKFTYKGEVTVTGKWRLTGGNNITFTASNGTWKQTYTVNLDTHNIGSFYRYNSDQHKKRMAKSAAVDTSNLTESDLKRVLYESKSGKVPAEFEWTIGEWRSESNVGCVALIEKRKAYTNQSSTTAIDLSDVKKERYTIGYKFNITSQCWFMAIIPEENLPVIYIDNTQKSLFYEMDGKRIELNKVIKATEESSASNDGLGIGTLIIIILLVGVIAALVGVIIVLTKKK